MSLKVHEFERIVLKLRMRTREGGDRIAIFEYNGVEVLRTKRSHQRGDLPFAHKIHRFKVNEQQFRGLIDCSVSLEDYVAILRNKGLLGPGSD